MSDEKTVIAKDSIKERRDNIKRSAAISVLSQLRQSSNMDMESVKKIGELLSSKEISHQERIEGLTLIQASLLSPMLGGLFAQDLDFAEEKRVRLAKDVYYIIGDLIRSEYTRVDHAEREVIDFRHPKIQKSYQFLIEVFIEALVEAEVDEALRTHIISRLSSALLAFEDILASKFHNVSNTAAEMVKNPLLDVFKNRETIFRKYYEDLEKENNLTPSDGVEPKEEQEASDDSPFGDIPSAADLPEFPTIEVLEKMEEDKEDDDEDVAIIPVFAKESDAIEDILPPGFIVTRDL